MTTTCPHCSAPLELDPETLAALRGQQHFACPSCQGPVPVPPLSGHRPVAPVRVSAPAAAIPTAPSSPAVVASGPLRLSSSLLILARRGGHDHPARSLAQPLGGGPSPQVFLTEASRR
jgi:hypothetical protein